MPFSISTLLIRNLRDVFGENDPARRRAAIDEIWTEEGVFYDPKSGVHRGRDEIDRVAGAIKACFASIGFCGLAAVGPAFAQAPENGDELARMMIKQAEADGGRVDMHRFGDGACFVAEGLSAAYVARRQFPGYPVAYREADPGNGLWFILLADHGKANVRIYAIKQGVLRWDVPENARVGDAMVCSDTADISTSAAVGSGPLFKPVPRSR